MTRRASAAEAPRVGRAALRAWLLAGALLAPAALLAPRAQAAEPVAATSAAEPHADARSAHAAAQLAVLARAAELARAIEPLGVGFLRPVAGPISSPFGWRDLSVGGNRFHGGIDVVARSGMPVAAARGGRVAFTGWSGAYGFAVFLDHETGWQTRYAHLSRIDVREGEVVRQGAPIGVVGSTGASTAPHLHFEVRFDGRALDPLQFVAR